MLIEVPAGGGAAWTPVTAFRAKAPVASHAAARRSKPREGQPLRGGAKVVEFTMNSLKKKTLERRTEQQEAKGLYPAGPLLPAESVLPSCCGHANCCRRWHRIDMNACRYFCGLPCRQGTQLPSQRTISLQWHRLLLLSAICQPDRLQKRHGSKVHPVRTGLSASRQGRRRHIRGACRNGQLRLQPLNGRMAAVVVSHTVLQQISRLALPCRR